MEHLKFKSVDLRKRDIFNWLTATLEEHGWERIESNHTSEGWIYRSKGESGKDDIIVNFRDGYDGHNNGYRFTTTTSRYFDIRMMISYTPNIDIGKNGTHIPALNDASFLRWCVGNKTGSTDLAPDSRLKIHYHCNKNRIIFTITTYATTVFMMFGKPNKNYAKEYKDTGNMIFTTNAYRIGNVATWGIADRPTQAGTALQALYNPINNGFYKDELLFCEIGYGSTLEGIKGLLEGIYYIPSTGKSSYNASMDGDKYVDDLGNEYTLMYMSPADSGSYSLSLGAGHIAICTKLAGED